MNKINKYLIERNDNIFLLNFSPLALIVEDVLLNNRYFWAVLYFSEIHF